MMNADSIADLIKILFYFPILFYGFFFIEKVITNISSKKEYLKITYLDQAFLKLFYIFVCLKLFGFFPFN